MSYTKHNYQKGDELLASQLNDMDDQIALNEETADALVQVSNTEPQEEKNRVWVKATSSEVEIPTMDDFDELNNAISDLDDELYAIKGTADLPLPASTDGYAYFGEPGTVISKDQTSSSYAYDSINLSNYVGCQVTVKFDTTASTSNRVTALCDENGLVGYRYYEKNMGTDGFVFTVSDTYKYLYISVHKYLTSNITVSIFNPSADIPALQESIKDLSSVFTFPSDFNFANNPLEDKIKITNDGVLVDFDVASLKNVGGVTYYVSPSGSDTNDGLSKNAPLQTIQAAINKEDVGTIILLTGTYNIYRIPTAMITKGLNIIADDNATPVLITARTLAWTKTDGADNVYQTSKDAGYILSQNYVDADGDMIPYTKVSTIAEVDAAEHTYCVISSVTYIHSSDAVDATVSLVEKSINIHAEYNANQVLYLEGIKVYGGTYSAVRIINSGTGRPKLYAKNCVFGYGVGLNSFYNQGADSILQNCKSMYSGHDGFNYHNNNSNLPSAIEINCEGKYNGILDGNTYNGSTIHDGGKIIRVGGRYYGNKGPNVADVNEGTETVNIDCVACDSVGNSTQNAGFVVETGKMWNVNCSGYGNTADYYSSLGAICFNRNSVGNIKSVTGGTFKAF